MHPETGEPAAVAEQSSEAAPQQTEPVESKPSAGDQWLRSVASRVRDDMPDLFAKPGETKPAESDSSKPGEQPPAQPKEQPQVKPLDQMSESEFRDALKANPKLYQVWQSEKDKAKDEGRRGALPETERRTEDDARTQVASLIAAGHDAALKTYDDEVLNGVLFNAIPQDYRTSLSGRKWGTGPEARVAAARAYVEQIQKASISQGRAERDAEIARDPTIVNAIIKKNNAQERADVIERGELPTASRGATPPTSGEDRNFNTIIRRRAGVAAS